MGRCYLHLRWYFLTIFALSSSNLSVVCNTRFITTNIGSKSNFLFTALRCHLKCICAKFPSQPEPNFNKFKSIPRRRNLCNGNRLGPGICNYIFWNEVLGCTPMLTLYHKTAGSVKKFLLHIVFLCCVCIIYICACISNLYVICNCICTCINMEWR